MRIILFKFLILIAININLIGQTPGTKKWEFLTGEGVYSSPAIGSDGTVYLGSWDRKVYALNGATGAKKWEFLTGRPVYSSPAIGSEGTLYVGSLDNKVYALNGATGATKWEFLTGNEVWSSPAIGSDGTVYVGSRDNKVYALNGATGAKKWEFLAGDAVRSSPAIGSDGTVYVVSDDNKVYALNGATGAKKWEFATGDGVRSSPAIGSDGTVYVGSFDNKVYALNGTTGATKWEFLTGGGVYSSPAIGSDGTVYVGSLDNKVYALNGATGATKWEFLTGGGVGSSPAIGSDGTVYVGSLDNKVYALNGATGAKKWEFVTGDAVHSSPAIGSDGTVYVGSDDNKVYAIYTDSTGLASADWPMYRGGPSRTGRSQTQQQQGDLVWRIQKAGKTMYLGGTVSALRTSDLPFPKSFDTAFSLSQKLVLQNDPVELASAAAESYISSRSMLLDNRNLKLIIEDSNYVQVQNLLISFGLPADLLLQYRPWFALQFLAQQSLLKNGFDPARAVDTYYFNLSKSLFKPRIFLDTYQQAVDASAKPSDASWADLIKSRPSDESLEYLINMVGYVGADLVQMWKSGDVEGVAQMMNKLADRHPNLYSSLIAEPLGRWIPTLEAQIQSGQTAFTLIRAGHLVGRDGVIKRLRERGFYISQLPLSAPVITAQPTSQGFVIGKDATLSVQATGAEPLYYYWSKDGVKLQGYNTNALKLKNLTTGNAGRYSVTVSNEVGVVVSMGASLSVVSALPQILTQPQGGQFQEGTNVIFYVEASGEYLSYQWKRDGVDLNGATNSFLTFDPVKNNDKGKYTVDVKNPLGTVTSQPVLIVVTRFPVGTAKWEFMMWGWVESSAIGSDGKVYLGGNGRVYALNGTTGAKKWEFLTGGGVSSPAIGFDGTVYVGSSDNKVYALNGATGAKKWEFLTGGWVDSSPAIGSDGTVYFGSYDYKVYALNGATGTKKWEFLTGSVVSSSPAIGSDGTVYFGSHDYKVYALNGATGAKKWEFLTGSAVSSSPAIGSDGTVYVGSDDGNVYALNGATGAKKWEFLTGGMVRSSPAIGSDGTVYVGSSDQKVYAIASDSMGLIASSWPRYRSLNNSQGQTAPYISIQPKTEGVAGAIGKRAVLEAAVISQMPVTLQWSKNGNNLPRATNSIFEIPSVTLLDEGYYQFTVSLADGRSVSTTFQIAVSVPEIVRQPKSGQFQEATNLVLYVEAKGYLLKYQWKRDGVDLPGATNFVLDFPVLRMTNNAKYTVTVSNPFGSVISQPAGLVVSRLSVGNKYWDFLTEGAVRSSPAIGSDGTVYVGSGDGKVYALNGATGAKKWEFLTGGWIDSSPAIGSDGTVYVGSEYKVYALNGATGAKKWEFLTEGNVRHSPAIGSDGTVYLGLLDSKVYALNGVTGAKKWEFLTEGPVWTPPAIGSDGTVYVGSKKVYALNGATGAKKWEFQLGGGVSSSPAIGSDGTVYVGSENGNVYALNGATGAKKWEFLTGGWVGSSPAIGSDGTVYVGSDDKKVYALNGATGAKKWEFLTGGEVYSSPAIGSDGTVYVGSEYKVYALNGATGAKKWEFLTGGMVRSSPAIGSDGTVYVGSYDSKVYAIASDSMGLMASSWPRYRSLNNSQGQTAPYISIQPKTEGVAGAIGKRAVLEAAVISQMPVTLQWSKNGNILPRATNSIFEIPSVTLLDEGYYQLTATLADGRSISTVFLIAVSLPEIIRQPQGGQFQETTNVILYVETKGYIHNYQWRRDGVDLLSATNSVLNLSVLRMTDGGQYTVTVSNPFGSVISQPVGIVVNRLPVGKKYWDFLTGGGVSSSPAIGPDGTVYVGSWDNKVYALSGATGAKKWEFLTEGRISSSPAIGFDGTVYVGSDDKKVYALNGATGAKKWEFLTGNLVSSSPAIGSDGTMYVGSLDGKVYALNGATGAKKWEFLTGGFVGSSPSIGSDGTVYVGSDDGNVYALNGATGAKKWEFLTGNLVSSSPAIGSGGTVYLGSNDKKVYALNSATGAKKWEFLTGSIVQSTPAIGFDGTVYVGSDDKKVYALNGATGAKKWEFLTGNLVSSSPAIGSDGTIYVGSLDGKVYALNGATGAKKWEFLTGDSVFSSPAIGSDGTVYVGSEDKKVYAIASDLIAVDSMGLIASSWPRFRSINNSQGQIAPLITIEPKTMGVAVSAGNRASLEVTAISQMPITLQWSKGGDKFFGATNSFYVIQSASLLDEGYYQITATGDGRSITTSVLLAISTEIVRQPQGGQFQEWTNIALSVEAKGYLLKYQWKRNGVDLINATNSILNFSYIKNTDGGEYTVEVSNPLETVTSQSAKIVVNRLPPAIKKWEFLTGGAVYSSPAIGSDGTVYVGSYDSKVYALNGATGAKKWEFLTGSVVGSSPAIGPDGTVYVGSADKKVYALNGATGAKKWEFLTGSIVQSTSAIGPDGTVYVGSNDKKVYALNGATGAKKWEFLTGNSISSSPAIGFDGTLYVGSNDKKVYALNGATGAKKWEFLTGGGVYSSPAIGSDGTVYVGSYDKKVYALNDATGAKKWEFLTGEMVSSSPAIGSDGTVYVGSDETKMYALNGATGAKKWEFQTGNWVSSSPAIGSDGTVYVGSDDTKVYVLNGATGAKNWEFLTGSIVRSSPAIGSDGTVYVGSGDGKVYAIASSSEGLAKSPWPKFHANNSNTGKFPSGSGPLIIIYSPQSGLNLNIPVSPDFDTILEYSTNLNQWSEQQRFGRQSNTPSIIVPLKMDQTKSMEYWRTRSQ